MVKKISTNRKAFHEYIIEEKYEAGISLKGAEVKSLREHGCSLQESYARPLNDEIFLIGMHIPPYKQATIDAPDPDRIRKLLLHKDEISYIISQCTQRGYTLIPLQIYFKRGWAKVKLGLARQKKKEDKRKKLIERQEMKEAQRHLKRHNR